MEEDLIQQSLDDYDAGKYSPRLLTAHELPLDAHVLEPDEDLQRLQLSRQQLQVTGAGVGSCPGAPYVSSHKALRPLARGRVETASTGPGLRLPLGCTPGMGEARAPAPRLTQLCLQGTPARVRRTSSSGGPRRAWARTRRSSAWRCR